MATVPLVVRSVADIHPNPVSKRFGLDLNFDDFDRLGKALERIGEAERSAEIAAATLRVF
jgi:hypothetical protein